MAGVILFALCSLLCPWWLAIGSVMIAAAAKEIYDRRHPAAHTADLRDWLYTAAGGCAGLLCYWNGVK